MEDYRVSDNNNEFIGNSMDQQIKKPFKRLRVKLYELNSIREIDIDLFNGRDRSKLKHILKYESHRLRKRDLDRYQIMLDQTKLH